MEIVELTEGTLVEIAKKAAAVVKRGGVILYPTDTVYGLGVDVHNEKAVAKLRQIKEREQKKPIAILVAHYEDAKEYAYTNEASDALAERFLPGPLTLVLPARPYSPLSIMLNDSVGIRIPNHPFTHEFSKLFPKGITATSANKSGRTPEPTIGGILEQLRSALHLIDLVIIDGDKPHAPSTVVSCSEKGVHVLREGALSKSELGL